MNRKTFNMNNQQRKRMASVNNSVSIIEKRWLRRTTWFFNNHWPSYTSLIYIIICLKFITVHCITANAVDFPPFIVPSDPEITVLPSENVNFTCRSTEPIHWRFFDGFDSNYDVHESYNQNNEYPFESIIELPNVDVTYVGYYYCVKNTTEIPQNLETLVDTGQASNLYLFVEDPQNPLVPVANPFLNGAQYQDIVIPCKPSSKMWDIQLIKEGDERHQFDAIFHPTVGYRIKLNELTDGGLYTCHAKFDASNEYDIHFNIEVDSGSKYVNKPLITSKTDNFGIEGGQLELNCTVEADWAAKLEFKWELPKNNLAQQEGRVQIIPPISEKHENNAALYKAIGKLIVNNLEKTKDAGIYKCYVEDNSNNRNSATLNVLKILGPHEWFLEMKEPNERYTLIINSTNKSHSNRTHTANWYVKYAGHPAPTLVWRDMHGNEIPWSTTEDLNRKIDAFVDKRSTTLKIHNPKIGDSGHYTLYADNGRIQKEQKFQLLVKEQPQINLQGISVKPGEAAEVHCEIFGFPTSTVVWAFIPCEKVEFDRKSCDESKKITYANETVETVQSTIFNQSSTLKFEPKGTGLIQCMAVNTMGLAEAKASLIVNDLDEEFSIWSTNEPPISIGDDVSVICGASAHKYANELNWYKDNVLIQSGNGVQVIPHDTTFSHRKEIRWNSIGSSAGGKYVCRANVIKDDSPDFKSWELNIVEPSRPQIIESTIENGKVLRNLLGEPLQMRCKFSGIPHPKITWYKDGSKIVPESNESRIILLEENTVLDVQFIKDEDEGRYKCVGRNRLGSVSREAVLKISNAPKVSRALIIGVISVILILVICTLYLCMRIRRERKLFRELKAAGLANFEEGNPDSINPDLTLDEQADLLPYDKKYEFPRERLKLGKQLGAGAFGVVIKGVAQGILPYEDETIVAVKMVKQMADNEVMRALISELKIMVHLGQHLNVVNLLGAVTKNIAQREVMVIVEYCRFGNLQNFLVKHRQYFIDQIVRDKDIIDPTIQTRDPRWSNDSGFSYLNRPDADRQSVVNSAYIRHANVGDYFPGGMDSSNTEATLLSRNSNAQPGGEDNAALSNNSTQPAWRSNYQSDYKGPKRSVTTTDLLCWSFQVARGMQYLASRKVLHGDLAARNILLCDDNVVKICDFGLARSMYKTDNYRKKGEGPLPFKWLALESISDQVFSTYSDVWSFGIVLWELFSLGRVPYPGMDADQALYFKLKDGYRMEKPDFATQDIYDIMLSCWYTNPESRPLFDNLEKSISKLLESGVAEHYIDLNEPYLQSNISNFNEGQTDYLALMGTPDCPAPPTPNLPNYVNSHIIAMQSIPTTSTAQQPEYLAMTTPININSAMPGGGVDTHDSHFTYSAINSPTIANNLNASNQNSPKIRSKITNIPEEIPMLKRSNQSIPSDSDTELNASDTLNSAGNSNTNLTQQKNADLLNTTVDNYVNVPSDKASTKKDAVSNPGYIVVSNINETKT